MTTLVFDTDEMQESIGDTTVTADYDVYLLPDGSHVINIYGWSSTSPKQGHTNKALQILRDTWINSKIVALDCGYPKHDSYAYWQHQLAKGRVDQALDDQRNPMKPVSLARPCRV
jgi:hypothetical protein